LLLSQIKNPRTSTKTSKSLARRGTRRSPMLAHETSPVSGASVMGITYGGCNVLSYLPAGVPGVSTARRQEDRLRLEGRLAIPPWKAGAGRRRQEPTNGCFAESGLAPTRATEAKDRSDERHDQVQPISDQGPFPMIGSKAKGRAYASQMPVPGERYFIKRNCQSRARGSRQGRRRRGAGSRPNCYPTCNQAPAYIRGPGPLVWGDRIFFFLL
jgi:hypothetical protein